MSELKLITLLADGNYHSGAELGNTLGVSRAAIWKQMNKLAELGLLVESSKGRGYRLPGGISLLDRADILGELSAQSSAMLSSLAIRQSLTSTNGVLRRQAEKEAVSGHALIAEQQTAGRGRRGRTWVSPFGRNIYLSLCWGFEGGAAAIEGLSLAVGVAVRQALKRCGARKVKLKWPNDLLWHNKKLAGILLEIVGDPSGYCQVIVGVGINVDMREEEAAKVDQAWCSLNQVAANPVSRSVVAGRLLDELLQVVSCFETKGFAGFRKQWLKADAFAGKPVKLVTVSKEVSGIARGVSSSGALRLEVKGEIMSYSGGEISVRELDDC